MNCVVKNFKTDIKEKTIVSNISVTTLHKIFLTTYA